MKKVLFSFVVLLLFLAGCNLTMIQEEQELSLNASDLSSLMMELDEGEIDIIGEQREDINIVATFASRSDQEELARQFQIENMTISLDQEDEIARLNTKIYRGNDSAVEARINIKAYIPEHLNVVINHEGGGFRLQDLKNSLTLNQGAGKVSLENIEGEIIVTDGTGSITLINNTGNINVNNNSGAVHMMNNAGNIQLISGSGDITLESVIGSVQIRSGSGSISVDDVDGDVTILENRSGTIDISNVSGEIKQ